MAMQLDPEDFNKLQNQLLELRDKNCTLEDVLRKKEKGFVAAEKRLRSLEEENQRYQRIVQSSKKHGEVELMMRDNNYLRNKLRDQEEDFRLQNNTLLQELSRLIGENERYERQVKLLCGENTESDCPDGDPGCTDDSKEVLRLRVELTDMEKKLHENENNFKTESSSLKEKITALNVQITQLRNVLTTHSIPIDEGEISLGGGGAGVSFKKLSLQDDDGLETDVERSNEIVRQYQEKASQLESEVERLKCQLKEDEEKVSGLLAEKTKLQQDLDKANERTELEEMQKSFKEVKSNLIRSNSSLSEKSAQCDKLLLELDSAKESHESLTKQLEECEGVSLTQVSKIEELEDKLKIVTDEKDQVLAENETHKTRVEEVQRELCQLKEGKEDQLRLLQEQNKDLSTQLEISNIQKQEVEESVEILKRKVADSEEEQRIHERKGLTLMKDLKKQLTVEKKRADRLQEKLSQLLTDPAQLTAITTMSDAGDDVSSVSSWSMVSGEPRDCSTRENSIIISPQGSPPPGVVTEETASLVNRVTDLQQQKWQLEERITHLESSSSAMAEDLLKKSAIITHYCMDKSSESTTPTHSSPLPPALGEKLNVRRMLELIRGGGEESVKEINRRLQSLLEETLSKNIQLQQDVENLSEQVHQLSKLAAVKADD